jgi:NDP-sugar pyrophosphorylase family protein
LCNERRFFFSKSILADIPRNIKYTLEEEFFPSMFGKKFFAYLLAGEVVDIGLPERYNFANKYFSS